MPLYEFVCKECGKPFELLAWDAYPKSCPHCGSLDTERKLSTFSFKTVGYPHWVDKVDDYQKKQADAGQEPTLPSIDKIK